MSTQVEPILNTSWLEKLHSDFQSDYFKQLKEFLLEEKKRSTIFPPGKKIFSALELTPFEDVKVVILGQDPYHNPGQAHGLCFSVPRGVKQPPSLVNIFKEINDELGITVPSHGNLESWARQGILLLNATLTVRAHQAGSHQGKGWEQFTDSIISKLSTQKEGLVFLLWGSYAQAKSKLIDQSKHFILNAPHPSPLSAYRGFFGCGHFKKTNEILMKQGKEPISWGLD